mgnify:CR=1 FL=1
MIRFMSAALSVGAEGAVFHFMGYFTFFEKIRLYLTKKVKHNDRKQDKSKVNQIEEDNNA